jgi:hypothetical protein
MKRWDVLHHMYGHSEQLLLACLLALFSSTLSTPYNPTFSPPPSSLALHLRATCDVQFCTPLPPQSLFLFCSALFCSSCLSCPWLPVSSPLSPLPHAVLVGLRGFDALAPGQADVVAQVASVASGHLEGVPTSHSVSTGPQF